MTCVTATKDSSTEFQVDSSNISTRESKVQEDHVYVPPTPDAPLYLGIVSSDLHGRQPLSPPRSKRYNFSNRLFATLFRDIFIFCSASTQPLVLHDNGDIRWRLCSVCRLWRAVAFTTPELWTNLEINFDVIYKPFSDPSRRETAEFLVHRCLLLTRNRPVKLVLKNDDFMLNATDPAFYGPRSICTMLAKHAAKFGSLTLVDTVFMNFREQDAPNLTSLTFINVKQASTGFNLPWAQIKRFACFITIAMDSSDLDTLDLWRLLRAMPKLEYLELRIPPGTDLSIPKTSIKKALKEVKRGTIQLFHLKTLILYTDCGIGLSILQEFHTPFLQELKLYTFDSTVTREASLCNLLVRDLLLRNGKVTNLCLGSYSSTLVMSFVSKIYFLKSLELHNVANWKNIVKALRDVDDHGNPLTLPYLRTLILHDHKKTLWKSRSDGEGRALDIPTIVESLKWRLSRQKGIAEQRRSLMVSNRPIVRLTTLGLKLHYARAPQMMEALCEFGLGENVFVYLEIWNGEEWHLTHYGHRDMLCND